MNPNFLMDGEADFRFDAFNEAHANPAKFIGGPDHGGDFQRGLFHLAPAKMRSRVDAFECVRHFSSFHILLFGCVADSFNDPTILSGALLLICKLGDRGLANIEQNQCCLLCLTQKDADFMRSDFADFQL
jgi:hypothetical protein